MPRIPQRQAQTLSTNVQREAPVPVTSRRSEAFGIAAQALGSVGSTLQRVEQAKDEQKAFETAVRDRNDLAEFKDTDIRENGHEGHSERVNTFVTNRISSRESGPRALSQGAFNSYNRKTFEIFEKGKLSARDAETRIGIQQSKEALSNGFDEISKGHIQNPQLDTLSSDINLIDDQIDSAVERGVYSPDQGPELKKQARKNLSESYLEGLFQTSSKDNKNIEQGLSILEGNEVPEISESLDSNAIAKQLKRFRTKKQLNAKVSVSEARNSVNDFIALAKNGELNQSALQRANITVSRIDNPEVKRDLSNMVRAGAALAEGVGQLKNTPPSDWDLQGTLDQITGDLKGFGAAKEEAFKKFYLQNAVSVRKSQLKDPKGYAVKNDPELRNMFQGLSVDPENSDLRREFESKLFAYQERMGLPKKRLSESEVATLSSAVNDPPTAQGKTASVNQLKQIYGDGFKGVMGELIESGEVDPGMYIFAYSENPMTERKIMDNISNKSNINEAFKTSRPGLDSSLKTEVASELQEYESAIIDGGNDSSRTAVSNSFKEHVTLEAKKLMLRDSDLDASDAIENATQNILGDMQIVENVIVPRTLNGDPIDTTFVESHIDYYTGDSDHLKELDIKVPSTFQGREDDYFEFLAENARWVNTGIRDGVQLVYFDPIRGIDNIPVQNIDGGRLQFDFNELSSNPNNNVVQNSKTFAELAFRPIEPRPEDKESPFRFGASRGAIRRAVQKRRVEQQQGGTLQAAP